MPRPNQEANWALQERYNPRTGHWVSDAKDILLRFLQDLFYQMPQGEHSFHFEPGQSLGSTDEKCSEVIITDEGTVSTSSLESRPAIILSRGQFRWGNVSLSGMLNDKLLAGGPTTFSDLLLGSFTVHCLSRSGLEAETLALIIHKALRIYRDLIHKAGYFHVGDTILGEERPAGAMVDGDSAEDFRLVSITFPVQREESWTTQLDAVLLRSIQLKAHHVAMKFDGNPLNPSSVDEDGNPIEGADGVIVHTWNIVAP